MLGSGVGDTDGDAVTGLKDGLDDGDLEGEDVGSAEDGSAVLGSCVGDTDGDAVTGLKVGMLVGTLYYRS